MITQNITDLVRYGVSSGLVDEADIIYTVNKLLELFELEEYDREFTPENFTKVEDVTTFPLEETLKEMLDYAQDILVIGADTVVAYENQILGKPKDEEDARRMLSITW